MPWSGAQSSSSSAKSGRGTPTDQSGSKIVGGGVHNLGVRVKFIEADNGIYAIDSSRETPSRHIPASGITLLERNAASYRRYVYRDGKQTTAQNAGDEKLHRIANELLVWHAASAQRFGNVVNLTAHQEKASPSRRAASALFRLAGSLINDHLRGDCSRTIRPRCMHTLGVAAVRDCQWHKFAAVHHQNGDKASSLACSNKASNALTAYDNRVIYFGYRWPFRETGTNEGTLLCSQRSASLLSRLVP
jgi:hypothetical protein